MRFVHFVVFCFASLSSSAIFAQANPHVPGTPWTPLPIDYYETAGRVKVQQPINNLTLPGGKRLFDETNLDTDGGLPRGSGSGSVRNPSGNAVPVNVTGRVSGAEAAKAIGRSLGRIAAKIALPIGVGSELYDLARELGFGIRRDASGGLVVEKDDPNVCTVSPCYEYYFSISGSIGVAWAGSLASACAASIGPQNANTSYYIIAINPRLTGQNCTVDFIQRSNGASAGSNNYSANSRSAAPRPENLLPSTQQEFLDAIAAKSGWPSSSAISRALGTSVEPGDPSIQLIPNSVTVSGPATSPGTTTTTNNTTNNTTTTNTTTHNHSYAGSTVSTSTTTNSTTINNTTNEVTNNTTTTSTPAPPPEPVETCGLPGKPACKIDETGTPEAPELKPEDKAAEVYKPLRDFAEAPESKLPTLPALNWAFTLPTGCTAIALPAFAPYLQDIDICPFLPMFHDLMSVVWVLGGLFGAIGTFWRNVFSQT